MREKCLISNFFPRIVSLNKQLRRASSVCRADFLDNSRVVDQVMLDAGERHRRRVVLTAEHGTRFLLDLPHATVLRDGDGLLLEDGSIVRVAGKREALVEITATSPQQLARLAWHIGNRHVDVEITGGRMRIRRDGVLEDMLRGLGAQLAPIEAPFEPEAGAYEQEHDHHRHES
jgi:urease accessory protein